VLVVRAALAANTLAELIALARTQPGKLTYASSGAGGAIHLASELFKHEAGVDIVHVPYRGGGPAVMGLLTGDVDIFINDASTTVENVRAGKLKALAVAASTRSPLLPQVPTFAELGFPAMVSSSWFGLAAPANTPADVIGALATAMPSVFASASYQAGLQKLGLEQFSLSPEQSAAFITAEFDKWAKVARSAGIQVD
jgi:tripartite-type tricarboxylate transporter receptor subunit TctC